MPQRDASGTYPLTLGEDPAYCPGCGQPVERRVLEPDHMPRLVCPRGHVTWRNPRIVVGTLPVRDGQVFLARRAIEPGAGRWSYPGGFLELGEAAQEGARRETEEETDLRVEVGRLVGAYSRPHAGIVTLVYEATVVGGAPRPAAETSEVRGFGPDEIPWDELAFSTTESALRDWVRSLPGHGPLHEPELYVEGDPGA
ncbi:MAG TPA: NUDIX hydrolase [candidate division Zixibacteria bacterium]|nr:NUDIX hydrolase [candidate division Zixibacteria bacterium]